MSLKIIKLVGEQKRILFLPPINPVAIKGVAGSGKTTVALYRAKHLVETYQDLFEESNIIVFTYNKSLAKYMEVILPYIPGGYQKDKDELLPTTTGLKIKIMNFHKWAYHFLTENKGLNLKTLDEGQIYEMVNRARKKYSSANKIANKSPYFFINEISWINGHLIKTEEEYMTIRRTGRGVTDRVTKLDRPIIWSIYQDYTQAKKNIGYVDFDDYALLCLMVLNEGDRKYSHIIIDEAQDLSKAELTVLGKLVRESTQSISIIADAAQSIYKSGFSWSDVGMNIRGRSLQLSKNYRNTLEIAKAAYSLLDKEPEQSDFTPPTLSDERHGDKPIIAYFKDESQQNSYLCNIINNIRKAHSTDSIVVLNWNSRKLNELDKLLRTNNIPCKKIKDDDISDNNTYVNICTMSSIKGLEYDVVIITGLNDEYPFLVGVDDDDKEEQVSRQRRLLYVSMTRAKDRLYLFSYGIPSFYLKEIDRNLVSVINDIPQ